jgi:hypothetical protein
VRDNIFQKFQSVLEQTTTAEFTHRFCCVLPHLHFMCAMIDWLLFSILILHCCMNWVVWVFFSCLHNQQQITSSFFFFQRLFCTPTIQSSSSFSIFYFFSSQFDCRRILRCGVGQGRSWGREGPIRCGA